MIDYPRAGKTGFKRLIPSWKLVLGSLVTLGVLVVGLFAAAVFALPVPAPNDIAIAESTKVYYADGKREIGRLGDVRRTNVSLSDVPVDVQRAVLTAEDREFFDHSGLSLPAIGRALWNNFTGGDTQGGSTVTQQYVRNAYLTQDRTWDRKLRELVLSTKLETIESKDEILSNYLNTIYFGRGAYGIQAASEVYFGKPASKLTVAEGAALAAMIKSPGYFEPELFEEQLRERWNYVLDGMVEEGWLTSKQRKKVEFPSFRKRVRANTLAGQTGYILEAVRREMTSVGWSEAEIEGGGLKIVTTIDKKAEDAAVSAVESAGPQYNTGRVRIGVTAVRPGTGEILAVYGGKDYLKDQWDNALQARAQGGSTFKAFTLAAALEKDYGLDSMWNGNSPATFSGYTLHNYANASYGYVNLLTGTMKSINTVYVGVENAVGVQAAIDAAQRAGLPKDTPGVEENLTFVLGTASPRAIDMASSFSTFASRGISASPTILREVRRSGGEIAYRMADHGERVFAERTMDSVNYALQAVVTSGTATRASWIGRPAAGKTGTTDGSKSAWFVGYTPQFSGAVMMTKENKKGQPVSLDGVGGLSPITGGSFPAAIWADFTAAALEGEPLRRSCSQARPCHRVLLRRPALPRRRRSRPGLPRQARRRRPAGPGRRRHLLRLQSRPQSRPLAVRLPRADSRTGRDTTRAPGWPTFALVG
ncbi:MAG: transglycosylase domain-containing protein [Candidatus Nanopelagicales bacterium]|nr:transglycosylase domain-containing protein [Candidatus Nanopelagicales bacterium]